MSDELQTRYYIGLTSMGCRVTMTLGPADPEQFHIPPGQPIVTADGHRLYPVDFEIAAEWTHGDEDYDVEDDDSDEDDQ